MASVPEKLGFAPERLAFAPERRGIASERLGFAPERLGFAPERLGFARIRKPATLIWGFGQGVIGICAWEACGSCKNEAYYSGLDIVGVCGAGYEHPGCWGLHI